MERSSQDRHPYTMTRDAMRQRKKYGFQRDKSFSGCWTMVRMRTDIRDALKRKFGSLCRAYEYALAGK